MVSVVSTTATTAITAITAIAGISLGQLSRRAMPADISVVMPAHNEGARLAATIDSIASGRTTDARVEIIIADDKSDDDTEAHLRAAWPDLSRHDRLDVHLSLLPERCGVPRARNHAAGLATADILFITDAHVRFPPGWDAMVSSTCVPTGSWLAP